MLGYIEKNRYMARIYDFNNFSSSSGGRESYQFSFGLEYIDIDVVNFPDEMKNIDTYSAELRYKAGVKIDKNGIYDIDFSVLDIDIRFEMDDYPNESIIEEMEIKPGVNIPVDQIKIEKGQELIPAYPSSLRIDMRKSNDPAKFMIEVIFGSDSKN
jgi:hypothetical protein